MVASLELSLRKVRGLEGGTDSDIVAAGMSWIDEPGVVGKESLGE